jgi:hypothetical protein
VSRVNSRASWKTPQSNKPRALPLEGGDAPRSITPSPPDTCKKPRSIPSTQETGPLRSWTASATSNTTATVEPASRKGCAEAITPDAEDATTVRRIGAPHPNHQARGSSAEPYDGRRSRPCFELRLPSPNTQGRRSRSYGSRITGWRASWEGQTTKASELMDIATKFASGQEAVKAIFRKDRQPQGRQKEDVPEASVQRGTKKKSKKKAQAKRNVVEADLVAAAERRNPQRPPGGANVFNKMLKESCPYHKGPVKHTLEECDMLRRYFNKAGPSAEGGKDQGNNNKGGDKEEEFPEVHNCFMIYGAQVANTSARCRKQERREVCSVKVATPVYLDWSNKPITFDQDDHPDYIPNLGRYPLVVDPVIGNTSDSCLEGG